MSILPTTHRVAIVAAIAVTVLWSSSWVLIRYGLDDENVAPLTFAGLRYGLASVVLLAWISSRSSRRVELRKVDPPMFRRLAVLGVVFVAITQGAQFVAIDSQPAATTSLTLAPTALCVAVASGRLIGERSSRRQIIGAALIVVGAGVYFAGDLGATVVGMMAALTGLVANVAGALLGRRVNRAETLSPAVVTGMSMSVGGCILLASGVLIEGWPSLTLRLVLIVGWLAIVNTALAFTLWNYSLRQLAAVESAAINNTMLVQIALLAWVFLDERPDALGAAGILVVTIGAFVSSARLSWPWPARRSHASVQLILATSNPVKRAWMTNALASDRVVVADLVAEDVDETGATCESNAILKAMAVGAVESHVVVAEDSGLFVNGLGGFPGTHTARWFDGTDDDRARALLDRCTGLEGEARSARFVSAVVLLFPDGSIECHRGELVGTIGTRFDGQPGDGYGAVFVPSDPDAPMPSNNRAAQGDHRHQALDSASLSIRRFARRPSRPRISSR